MQNIPVAPPADKASAQVSPLCLTIEAQSLCDDGASLFDSPLTPQDRLLAELRDAERQLAEVEVQRLGRSNDELLHQRVNAARDRVLAIRRALQRG